MFKINPNHEMFEVLNEIVYRIAACTNPHLFWGNAKDVPEPERVAELAKLKQDFEDTVIFIRLMT